MNKIKVIIGLLLIFMLGVLVGSLGTHLYFKYRFERFAYSGPPPLMQGLMRIMIHKLSLTKAQQVEIEKIIRPADKKLSSFREKFRPEFEKIIDDTMAQIKKKLNDEQKKKLDRLRDDLKRGGPRKPPPDALRRGGPMKPPPPPHF
jgi:hypothetical protein